MLRALRSCPRPRCSRAPAAASTWRCLSRLQSSAATALGTESDWLARGAQWVSWDPNPETATEIRTLVERGDVAALEARLSGRLNFGTAGIRGPMGSGSLCMNELTVIQTTQGLLRYLEQDLQQSQRLDQRDHAHQLETATASVTPTHRGDCVAGADLLRQHGVCIGYDHRQRGTLSSEKFALLAAAVFLSQNVPVTLYRKFVPTPLVPWCVEELGCAAGVMVTASHNPKEDNGYKVYWRSGHQITPPHDRGIARCIEDDLQPWAHYDATAVTDHPLCADRTVELEASYFDALGSRLCTQERRHNRTAPPVVYSGMHGVGAPFVAAAFDAFGLPPYIAVVEQCEPDPTFPTVAFPNPEEKSGLTMAIARAEQSGASLVLANDPDADRLAVAERSDAGEWKTFSGDEVGVLLAHWQWRQHRTATGDTDGGLAEAGVTMLASTVSSSMLGAVAKAEGFRFEETLTGFKWMGRRSAEIRSAAEPRVVPFAYEEAIGYCVGDLVKDKDGVSAAAVFYEMAATLRREENISVAQQYERLCERYGHFVSDNGSVLVTNSADIRVVLDRLRVTCVEDSPRSLGPYQVLTVRDLWTGFDSAQPDNRATLPQENMLTLTLSNGGTATVRASGTEPKIKYYCEVGGAPGQPRQEVKEAAAALREAVVVELLRLEEHGISLQ